MVSLMRYTLSTTLLLARSSSAFLSLTPAATATSTPTPSSHHQHHLFNKLFSSTGSTTDSKYPIMADESVMSPKAHGTSEKPVQKNLRWNCEYEVRACITKPIDRRWLCFPHLMGRNSINTNALAIHFELYFTMRLYLHDDFSFNRPPTESATSSTSSKRNHGWCDSSS